MSDLTEAGIRRTRTANIVCFAVIAAVWLVVAAFNLYQPERPAVSENERRTLAAFPEFSIPVLLDGSYFRGIDDFITDTFIGRETLVKMSRSFRACFGISSLLDGSGLIAYIPSDTSGTDNTGTVVIPSVPGSSGGQSGSGNGDGTGSGSGDGTGAKTGSEAGSAGQGGAGSQEGTAGEENPDGSGSGGESGQSSQSQQQPPLTPPQSQQPEAPATDFLPNGFIIYNKSIYTLAYLVSENARQFALVMDYFAQLFPQSRISSLPIPLSSGMLDNSKFQYRLTDQRQILLDINAMNTERVRSVFVFDALWAHRDEYIYFHSDHHWTARGAYYAYRCFAESVGFKPAELADMEETTLSGPFIGSLYNYSGDERVREFYDTVYAYYPAKAHTMTVYGNSGAVNQYDSSIINFGSNYSSFIAGDNPYTVINVPDNPEDRNILVIKDSFGNAMIPYLVWHYHNIYVVDPRLCKFNVYESFKGFPLTDILFLNNISFNSTAGWAQSVISIVTAQ